MRSRIPVLVIGAGPTGLFTAIELRRRGVDVEIIEVQRDLAGRSYALALHASTMDRLREAGIDDADFPGPTVEDLVLEGAGEARIPIALESSEGERRPVAVVSQASLERLLRDRLVEMGTEIRWHHRLAGLDDDGDGATARIERIETGATGFTPGVVVSLVAETLDIRADFVVGADGHNSTVRTELGLALARVGALRTFAVFDVLAAYERATEARIFLAGSRASSLWPLGEGRWRWTLEVDPSMAFTEPRFKSRSRWEPAGVLPRDPRQTLEHLLERHIPDDGRPEVERVVWSTTVSFEERLAEAWGSHRCWLVGDAAHLWTPLGIQSMNLGIQEAGFLAASIAHALESGEPQPLVEYGTRCRDVWKRRSKRPVLRDRRHAWLSDHASQFPGCLPASGTDLDHIMADLGFEGW